MKEYKKLLISLGLSNSDKRITFKIEKKFCYIFFSILCLVLTIVIIFAFLGVIRKESHSKYLRLLKENSALQTQITKIDLEINALNKELNRMEKWEEEIRDQNNLPFIEKAIRLQGTGGEVIIDSLLYAFPDSTALKLSLLIKKTYNVKNRLTFNRNSHLEVINSIDKQLDLYNYTPSIYPTYGRISDKFGWRKHPITNKRSYHSGIDIANKTGTPIYATADGTVERTGRLKKFGKYIALDHKYGYSTRYAHLHQILIKKGQKIKKGQIIGYMGNTGRSTGSHLHYEIKLYGRLCDPINYLNKENNSLISKK